MENGTAAKTKKKAKKAKTSKKGGGADDEQSAGQPWKSVFPGDASTDNEGAANKSTNAVMRRRRRPTTRDAARKATRFNSTDAPDLSVLVGKMNTPEARKAKEERKRLRRIRKKAALASSNGQDSAAASGPLNPPSQPQTSSRKSDKKGAAGSVASKRLKSSSRKSRNGTELDQASNHSQVIEPSLQSLDNNDPSSRQRGKQTGSTNGYSVRSLAAIYAGKTPVKESNLMQLLSEPQSLSEMPPPPLGTSPGRERRREPSLDTSIHSQISTGSGHSSTVHQEYTGKLLGISDDEAEEEIPKKRSSLRNVFGSRKSKSAKSKKPAYQSRPVEKYEMSSDDGGGNYDDDDVLQFSDDDENEAKNAAKPVAETAPKPKEKKGRRSVKSLRNLFATSDGASSNHDSTSKSLHSFSKARGKITSKYATTVTPPSPAQKSKKPASIRKNSSTEAAPKDDSDDVPMSPTTKKKKKKVGTAAVSKKKSSAAIASMRESINTNSPLMEEADSPAAAKKSKKAGGKKKPGIPPLASPVGGSKKKVGEALPVASRKKSGSKSRSSVKALKNMFETSSVAASDNISVSRHSTISNNSQTNKLLTLSTQSHKKKKVNPFGLKASLQNQAPLDGNSLHSYHSNAQLDSSQHTERSASKKSKTHKSKKLASPKATKKKIKLKKSTKKSSDDQSSAVASSVADTTKSSSEKSHNKKKKKNKKSHKKKSSKDDESTESTSKLSSSESPIAAAKQPTKSLIQRSASISISSVEGGLDDDDDDDDSLGGFDKKKNDDSDDKKPTVMKKLKKTKESEIETTKKESLAVEAVMPEPAPVVSKADDDAIEKKSKHSVKTETKDDDDDGSSHDGSDTFEELKVPPKQKTELELQQDQGAAGVAAAAAGEEDDEEGRVRPRKGKAERRISRNLDDTAFYGLNAEQPETPKKTADDSIDTVGGDGEEVVGFTDEPILGLGIMSPGQKQRILPPAYLGAQQRRKSLTKSPRTPGGSKPREITKVSFEFPVPPEQAALGAKGIEIIVDIVTHDDMSSLASMTERSVDSEDTPQTRMDNMVKRWTADDEAGDAGDEEKSVKLSDNVLDNVVIAAPNLEEAIDEFEKRTGVRPQPSGKLKGLGAKTAVVILDDNRYIEIVAPDPDAPAGGLGEELKKLPSGSLEPFHYAIRTQMSKMVEGYVSEVLGWKPDHISMAQAREDGNGTRNWELMTFMGHRIGGIAPSYIKWNDTLHHPTSQQRPQAALESLHIQAPEGHVVHKLLTGVDGIQPQVNDHLMLCLTIRTPKGKSIFIGMQPPGYQFPGYDDPNHKSQKLEFPGMPEQLSVEGNYSSDEWDLRDAPSVPSSSSSSSSSSSDS